MNLQLCQQWVLQVKWAIGSMCAIGRLGRCAHCSGLCNGHNIFRNGWKLFLPKWHSGWASSLLAMPALFLNVSFLPKEKTHSNCWWTSWSRQVMSWQSQNQSQTHLEPCLIPLVTLPMPRKCPTKWTHSSVVIWASLWQTPLQLDSTQYTWQEHVWNLWQILLMISTSMPGMFVLNRVRVQYMKPTHAFT